MVIRQIRWVGSISFVAVYVVWGIREKIASLKKGEWVHPPKIAKGQKYLATLNLIS
jgi:hypothetical protein